MKYVLTFKKLISSGTKLHFFKKSTSNWVNWLKWNLQTVIFLCIANCLKIVDALIRHESVYLFDCHGWLTWTFLTDRQREGGEESQRVWSRKRWREIQCVSVIFFLSDGFCGVSLQQQTGAWSFRQTECVCVDRVEDSVSAACVSITCVSASCADYQRFACSSLNLRQLHQTSPVPTLDKDRCFALVKPWPAHEIFAMICSELGRFNSRTFFPKYTFD